MTKETEEQKTNATLSQSAVQGLVIKPCPFCGNDETNLHFDVTDKPKSSSWVTCSMCNADGPVKVGSESAIKFWNMRVL